MLLQKEDNWAKWLNTYEEDPRKWSMPLGHTHFGHTDACLHKSHLLVDLMGFDLYRAMNLEEYAISFVDWCHLHYLSTLVHDIGKMSTYFRRMIRSNQRVYERGLRKGWSGKKIQAKIREALMGNPQKVRHEFAGALFLMQPEAMEWLKAQAKGFHKEIIASQLGHHLKTNKHMNKRVEMPGPGQELEMPAGPVVSMLRDLIQKHKLPFEPFPLECPDLYVKDVYEAHLQWHPFLSPKIGSKWDTRETRLSMSLKIMLVLADTFGSMSPKKGFHGGDYEFTAWMDQVLRDALCPREISLKGAGRLTKKVRENPYPHQVEALESCADLLIDVSCGGGKSEAALFACCDLPEYRSSKRIAFLEPVRSATMTMFNRLAKNSMSKMRKDIGLKTSTAMSDLVTLGMAEIPDVDEKDDTADIMETLKWYGMNMTCGTVDQLLGIMAFRRNSLLWVPLLVKANVVFDEFHDYDQTMQRNFTQFLRAFPGLRAIAMSATVSPEQEKVFKKCRPDATILTNSDDGEDLSRLPRYRFHKITREEADALFDTKGNSLWFVNTVARCQKIGVDHPDSLVFHSRFRHKDKTLLGDSLEKRFKGRGSVQAVTTQIAQKTYDISATQLISEMCPPHPFIQGVGRAGDRGKKPKKLTNIYFFMPENSSPYTGVNLEDYLPWYEALVEKDSWSFHELTEHLKDNSPDNDVLLEGECLEIASYEDRPMMQTIKRPVRNPDGKRSCFREQDLPEIKEALKKARGNRTAYMKVLDDYTFTDYIPRGVEPEEFHYRAVVSRDYDPRLGVLKPEKETK